MTDLVSRLTGVYHADGSLRGELKYAVGKLFGTAHCALCDITHRGISEKGAFTRCRSALPVPFDTVHLDERDEVMRNFTAGHTPCVVAHVDTRLVMLLDADTLDRCDGDVTKFRDAIDAAVTRLDLSFVPR